MTRLYIHQGNRPSASARVLVNTLKEQGVRAARLKDDDEPLWGYPVFNWGNTVLPGAMSLNPIVNSPESVAKAVSKITTASCLEQAEVPCVKTTTDRDVARRWVQAGKRVFARRDGLSLGRGIQEVTEGEVPEADFYSRYFPKTHEFRVHIFNGQAIDIVEKKRLGDASSRTIRTHNNGWVFAHGNLSLEDTSGLKDLAKRAVAALGLTFGAVDVLGVLDRNSPRRLSKAVICEVNTAPGLENQATIQAYTAAIKEYTGNDLV